MHVGLVVVKTITMLLGFLIAYQAYRGYRRHDSETMGFVALGFGFISVGAVIEGILFDVAGFSFHDAGTVSTAIVALGMLSVLYALYGRATPAMQ